MPRKKQPRTTAARKDSNPAKNRFWNFSVVNENGGENAPPGQTPKQNVELRISGDIVDDEDMWFYEMFGDPATSPNTFRQALSAYKGQDITVWINSPGGSTVAAAGIYSALQEHDGTVTVKIDGEAMSAASVIAMAGDQILMSPLAVMMIHNPLGSLDGYYQSDDLKDAAAMLDELKETIVNAYQLGTGLDRATISKMMDDEVYMSAQTAVRAGFADGILYVDGDPEKTLDFSFARNSIARALPKPEHLKALLAKVGAKEKPGADAAPGTVQKDQQTAAAEEPASADNKKITGGTKMAEIKNTEDLKAQLPDIHNEVYNAGAAAERARLLAIDALNGKVDPEFLAAEKAKDGATAESIALKAVSEGKLVGADYVARAKADAAGANKVPGTASDNAAPDEVTAALSRTKNIAELALGTRKEGK